MNGSAHDTRVAFLEVLADLVGCTDRIGGLLPDGKRPDVLALDPRRGTLFVGEGKDTERPSTLATQARLLAYLRWAAAHVSRDAGGAVCAVCFGRDVDSPGWLDAIVALGLEAGITFDRRGSATFGDGLIVVYGVASRIVRRVA